MFDAKALTKELCLTTVRWFKNMKRNKARKITMLRMLRNKRGVALIWSYLLSVSLLTMLTSFYTVSTWDLKNLAIEGQRTQAFYLAEAGIDKMLTQIKAGNFSNINATQLGTSGSYEVTYNATNQTVTSVGRSNLNLSQTLVAKVGGVDTGIPPGALSAFTVGNIDISGNFYIDGSNHDANGTLLNDGNGMPGIAYYGDTFTKWPDSVFVGSEGETPAYPSSPTSELSLTANDSIKSVNAVFGLSESSTVLNQYKHDIAPSEALDNEVYYFMTGNPKTMPQIDLAGGNGILIVDGNIHLSGSFTGLIVVHGASQITFENVGLIGGFVATAPNTTSYTINEMTDDSTDTQNFTAILFSREVLSQLPTIEGAVYVNARPYVSVWADNFNGSNRFSLTEATPAEDEEEALLNVEEEATVIMD